MKRTALIFGFAVSLMSSIARAEPATPVDYLSVVRASLKYERANSEELRRKACLSTDFADKCQKDADMVGEKWTEIQTRLNALTETAKSGGELGKTDVLDLSISIESYMRTRDRWFFKLKPPTGGS